MKKIVVILSLVTICSNIFAQIDTLTNNVYQQNRNLGIGISSPLNALTIEGTETEWPGRIFFSIFNKSLSAKSLAYMTIKAGFSDNHAALGYISKTYSANDSPEDLQDFGILTSSGKGLIIGATKSNRNPGIIKFVSGQSSGTTFDERMRIDSTGYIGIGTKSPSTKLQIADGDIYISDIEKGIIMKSPDGNCWRGVLDNSGQLNFSYIDCPDVINEENNIQQEIKSENIVVFPNPTKTQINIELSNTLFKKLEYNIFNLAGQIQSKGKLKSNSEIIDISTYPTGAYILSIYDKKGNKLTSQR